MRSFRSFGSVPLQPGWDTCRFATPLFIRVAARLRCTVRALGLGFRAVYGLRFRGQAQTDENLRHYQVACRACTIIRVTTLLGAPFKGILLFGAFYFRGSLILVNPQHGYNFSRGIDRSVLEKLARCPEQRSPVQFAQTPLLQTLLTLAPTAADARRSGL